MRVFLTLCLAAGLGGCNMVLSDRPLFTAADATGPALREGLWLTVEDDCPVDTRKPTRDWPFCADWGVLRNGVVQRRNEFPSETYPDQYETWSRAVVLLAAGEPMILQAGTAQEEPFFDERPEPELSSFELFSFHALEPTERDDQGRIVAVRAWTVQCGPRARKANGRLENETREPLPGLTKRRPNCSADTREAVINAAKASRDWTPKPAVFRWIRDDVR